MAFDVPLDATSNSWEGYTRKLALAGRSINLALPLTAFIPLSRKCIATSLIKLYDWARNCEGALRVNDSKGPGVTVTVVESSKLKEETNALPIISPTA